MKHTDNRFMRDVLWTVSNRKLMVRNVPYSTIDAEGEEFISVGTSLKLELIKELMLHDEIPYEVDFSDVTDLKFSN